MAIQELETTHEPDAPGVATLLSGIMDDARQLIVQQLTLFQVEIKNDLRRALSGLLPLLAGAGILHAAMILLGAGLALALSAVFPALPTWAGFVILGGIVALTGVALMFWAKSMLVNLTPEKTLEGLKENLQWKTKT
jgi:hypothetical protein